MSADVTESLPTYHCWPAKFSRRDGFRTLNLLSAVRRDQRLAHPGGIAANAASREGWVKGQHYLEPQRGDTEPGPQHGFLCCAASSRLIFKVLLNKPIVFMVAHSSRIWPNHVRRGPPRRGSTCLKWATPPSRLAASPPRLQAGLTSRRPYRRWLSPLTTPPPPFAPF